MKKYIIFVLVAFFAVASYGQNKNVKTVTIDTVKGAETVVFNLYDTGNLSKDNGTLVFQALATNIGGTTNELFQFHYGTIESILVYLKQCKIYNFNSTMVRLRAV